MAREPLTEGPAPEIMRDNTLAWKTASGNYYARRVRYTPKLKLERDAPYDWTHILYFTLDRRPIPLARAQCSVKNCRKILESKHCGDFVSCRHSFVDTDRWMPERHRYGGKAEPI